MFGGSHTSMTIRRMNLMSMRANVWMVNGTVIVCGLWIQDWHTRRGGSFCRPLVSLSSQMVAFDSITDHFGVVRQDNESWAWFLVTTRTIWPMCYILHCTKGCCIKLVVLLVVLCLASASLGVMECGDSIQHVLCINNKPQAPTVGTIGGSGKHRKQWSWWVQWDSKNHYISKTTK